MVFSVPFFNGLGKVWLIDFYEIVLVIEVNMFILLLNLYYSIKSKIYSGNI